MTSRRPDRGSAAGFIACGLLVLFVLALVLAGHRAGAQNFPTIGQPGSGSGTATTVAAGATINAADGSALTNLTYRYTTNAITAATLAYGKAYTTNLQGNVTVSLGAPTNSYFETGVMRVTNSTASDHSVTFPAGVIGPPGSGTPAVIWCTNKMVTFVYWSHYGQDGTNCWKQDFAP